MTPIELHANEIYAAIQRAAAAGYRLVSFQVDGSPFVFLDLKSDDGEWAVVDVATPTTDNETSEV